MSDWWQVLPGRGIPSFPLEVEKAGGGTVVLLTRNWSAVRNGEVVGIDSGGGRWVRRADGLVEPE